MPIAVVNNGTGLEVTVHEPDLRELVIERCLVTAYPRSSKREVPVVGASTPLGGPFPVLCVWTKNTGPNEYPVYAGTSSVPIPAGSWLHVTAETREGGSRDFMIRTEG